MRYFDVYDGLTFGKAVWHFMAFYGPLCGLSHFVTFCFIFERSVTFLTSCNVWQYLRRFCRCELFTFCRSIAAHEPFLEMRIKKARQPVQVFFSSHFEGQFLNKVWERKEERRGKSLRFSSLYWLEKCPTPKKKRLTTSEMKKPRFKPRLPPGLDPGPLGQNAIALPLAPPPLPSRITVIGFKSSS